jgi:hypothetical protein
MSASKEHFKKHVRDICAVKVGRFIWDYSENQRIQ